MKMKTAVINIAISLTANQRVHEELSNNFHFPTDETAGLPARQQTAVSMILPLVYLSETAWDECTSV